MQYLNVLPRSSGFSNATVSAGFFSAAAVAAQPAQIETGIL
jgi:hypothetical protein